MAAALTTAKGGPGIALALILLLAGCTSMPDNAQVSLPVLQAAAQSEVPAAEEREHLRILASYGGVYENARLQAEIDKTVDRLVAASERPDLKYKVTILNSPAINAFALPNGRLYVTRGLIALANDRAELASVLAHEMGHVIARHAAIREDQAKQAALISHVVSDVLSDPQMGALALAKSKLTLAAFSRAQEFEADGIGVGISARAGFDPYGASRFLADMQRNADLKRPAAARARALDFLSTHPATPERIKNALANARQFHGPGTGERDRDRVSRRGLDGLAYGEDPSEGFVRGRRFLHPKLGFTFLAPPGFILDNTAQAVLGLKRRRRSAAARRGQRSGRAVAARIPEVRLDGEGRSGKRRTIHRQRLPGGDRDRERRPMVVPPVRRALRQRRLSLHLRREEPHAASRPLVPRVDRQLPPHEPAGERAGASVAHQDRRPSAPTTPSRSWRTAWRPPITRSTASASSTASDPTTR